MAFLRSNLLIQRGHETWMTLIQVIESNSTRRWAKCDVDY